MNKILLSIILILNISLLTAKAEILPNCKWDNRNGIPCININKTNNTSKITKTGINKIIITNRDCSNY